MTWLLRLAALFGREVRLDRSVRHYVRQIDGVRWRMARPGRLRISFPPRAPAP
jgi:hypothetical protein